jgi:penicillin-binding protein A
MASQVRRLSLFVSLCFVLVAGALGYWQVFRADSVLAKPTNPRLIEEERRILRGNILDRNGQLLASSQRDGELARRIYHYAPLAHVTGYVSTRYGKTGVEDAYDDYLRGERGLDTVTALRNRIVRTEQHGTDVVLTIDLELQRAADAALGDRRGAIVALNSRTGEVLALASHPYFDPNTLDESWARLSEDSSRPFVHRAIAGQYVPGSTYKVITASAALDLGIAQPTEHHHHEADLIVDGFRIRNTNHPQLTDLTFAEEFAWSCNVALAFTGLSLGFPSQIDFNLLAPAGAFMWPRGSVDASVDRFLDYSRRFGMAQKTPFDLPTGVGRISESGSLNTVQLANTAFGQGELQVTPLQMALAVAAINNGGYMPTPYLASEVKDAAHAIALPGNGGPRRVVGASAAATLNAMMVLSVDTAYAQPARIPGVLVGGKTGTAEVGNGQTPHSWFVGYAPADRPGVAVAVILENAGSGTTFATPAGQKVLEAAVRLGY